MYGTGDITKDLYAYEEINTVYEEAGYVVHKLWPRFGTIKMSHYYNISGSTKVGCFMTFINRVFIRCRVVSFSFSFLSGVFCYDVFHLIDHSFCFFSLPSFTVTTRHHVQLISSKITKMEALLKLKESIEVLLAIHGIKED